MRTEVYREPEDPEEEGRRGCVCEQSEEEEEDEEEEEEEEMSALP